MNKKELINSLLLEASKDSKTKKKYLNPETGNKVGYARALALGLIDTNGKTPKKNPISNPENTQKEKKEKKAKEVSWYSAIQEKFGITNAPIGVSEDKVKVDLSDPNNKAIFKWKDPTTGVNKTGYSRAFMQKNAKVKWKRIEGLKPVMVDGLKSKVTDIILSPKSTDSEKQTAAIISIIANTGIRPGNKILFKQTGNRGASTLSADNIEINGTTINLNFTGKSYKQNVASFNDRAVALYLTKLKKEKENEEFLFNVNSGEIDKMYKSLGMKKYKIKDLRTFTGSKLAQETLSKVKPTILKLKGEKDLKKFTVDVKKVLQSVFETVSTRLNNTPGMAKTSYIHPNIINNFLKEVGIEPVKVNYTLTAAVTYSKPSLLESDEFALDVIDSETEDIEADQIEEANNDVDEYPLPDWWEDPNIVLKPIQ